MKKYLYTLVALLLITISAKAQKLTVLDSDGNGIHLDAKDFKEKKKELKKKYVALMNLNDLEAYATSHHIPALTPTTRRAIEGLKK